MGRFILASALYTKWAFIRTGIVDEGDAERYFQEAWSLYPYPERVIEEADKHPYTQRTARELRKWKQQRERTSGDEKDFGV